MLFSKHIEYHKNIKPNQCEKQKRLLPFGLQQKRGSNDAYNGHYQDRAFQKRYKF